ncbi:ATP-binding protein [Actinocorallia aurantiaca]|uniref:ATP-binding protein n=1 Tax=Actinocorallia aurantiaca TaxID=46204 RepID=UPI0031DF8137
MVPPHTPFTALVPRDPAGPWIAERPFKIDPSGEGVAEARRWALSLTSPTCAARDELTLVLSELLGNVATHAGGGEVTLTLAHTPEGLTGNLVHHQPPTNETPEIPTQIGTEIAHLLGLDDQADDTLISALAEGGRGLFTVAALTAGSLHTHQDAHSTTTHWTLDSCHCQPGTEAAS